MDMDMDKKQDQIDQQDKTNHSRRDFLRKSKYAAYATPLMTGLIIKSAAACNSGGNCGGNGGGGSVGFS